ncbi:MAG: PH domain-containing protein [Rubripirellula sp.]|nr:PH domain-containing protein [Rubripirellula sp.]
MSSPEIDPPRSDSSPDATLDRAEVNEVVASDDAAAIGAGLGRQATSAGLRSDGQVSLEPEARLHVSTLWLPAAEAVLAAIVPLVIGCFVVSPFFAVSVFVVFVFLPAMAYQTIRFFTLTYRMADHELIIRSGLLSRRERRIPFDRVQEVEIRQSFLHRLFRLAKVTISTAGSDTQEAALNVLTMHAAEVMKTVIADKHRAAIATIQSEVVAPRAVADYCFRLNVRTLLVGGLTSKVVATLGAVVGAILYFQVFVGLGGKWVNGVSTRIASQTREKLPGSQLLNRLESELPDTGVLRYVADLWMMEALSKSIVLAICGLVFAVVAYVVRYHAFELSRTGNLLSLSHGLLTYRHSSLARDRIQALKLEEGLLRRWFGLAAVRVDSAGDHQQVDKNQNRDVLIPVAKLADAMEVTRQAIPGLMDVSPDWQRISPLAIKRGSKKGWLLIVAIMFLTYSNGGWYCLMWLPAFPLVYLLQCKWYQHTGYWHGDRYLLFRQGWINRATICVPIKNVQSVILEQNFFDRRLELASLSIDIAGQSNTGGGPRIRQLPLAAAESLHRSLVQRAAQSEFRW